MKNNCVRAMFRVQKERGEPACLVPSAPELHDLCGDHEPMSPNSTFTPANQARAVAA